jgi:hypothetical protein
MVSTAMLPVVPAAVIVFPLAIVNPAADRVVHTRLVSGASRQTGNPLILLVMVIFPFEEELYIRTAFRAVCAKATPEVLVSEPSVTVVELLTMVIVGSNAAVARPAPVPFSNV